MMNNIEGIIIKGVAGFFEIRADDGSIWQAKARGKVRRNAPELLVGDRVRCSVVDDRVVIDDVSKRRNQLQRPQVANVDQVILVMACSQPAPNWLLLDRLLLMAEQLRIRPVIFLNKADLVSAEQGRQFAAQYSSTGYSVILGSQDQEHSLLALSEQLGGRLSVLAGPSGVGKSSLLNRIHPQLELAVGDISAKLRRGRHTTRQAQLFVLPSGGMIADTPGFYAFESLPVSSRELASHYPEMRSALGKCRFGSSCLHQSEPDCAVKELLSQGSISALRYQNYTLLLKEMIEKERKY